MLRPSRHNPNISANEMTEGNFDFNKTHLAPPVTNVIFHKKPNTRRTWFKYGIQGWYIEMEVEKYWCYKVYIYNTRVENIAETV